mmetsp:Transcript_335/g.593  ORF Transcript_335/g.593 Transcript_335/m.593 type:complete len:201 (+) Transcript_335:437-1039(+)
MNDMRNKSLSGQRSGRNLNVSLIDSKQFGHRRCQLQASTHILRDALSLLLGEFDTSNPADIPGQRRRCRQNWNCCSDGTNSKLCILQGGICWQRSSSLLTSHDEIIIHGHYVFALLADLSINAIAQAVIHHRNERSSKRKHERLVDSANISGIQQLHKQLRHILTKHIAHKSDIGHFPVAQLVLCQTAREHRETKDIGRD